MKAPALRFAAGAALALLLAVPAAAEISSDEIARLGKDLTPLGAEKAGNADGTIPEWTGGITKPPPGYKLGEHHRDPYADDKPLFVIDKSNLDKYRDKLSLGHQRMLAMYPTFKLTVYPTRRSASAPQRIYDATRKIAATAKLVDEGNGVDGAIIGIPFPIPKNGLEVIWNHLLRYRGETVSCTLGQAAVTRGGDYTLVKYAVDVNVRYSLPGMTRERLGNTMILFKQRVTAPARLRGRHRAGPRDHQPTAGAAPRVDVQPGPAAGAARPRHRLRQPRHHLRRAADRGPVRHVQRRGGPL